MNRIALGTSHVHRLFSRAERLQLLQQAIHHGVSHFDTAPSYGHGLAEASIGALGPAGRNLHVATKVGLYPPLGIAGSSFGMLARKFLSKAVGARASSDFQVARARASLDDSLRRLRRERVEYLLAHEPKPELLASEEWLRWLEQEKQNGRILAFGLSGEVAALLPFVEQRHTLTAVLQSRDSVGRQEAAALRERGAALQFSFGHLAGMPTGSSAREIIRQYLDTHPQTTVVFGTSRADHLKELLSAA